NDFAFAYVYSRSNDWITEIRSWMAYAKREIVPEKNLLTGRERETPEAGQDPPKKLGRMFTPTDEASRLSRGQISVYAFNALCDPDPARPCDERRANGPDPK